MNKFFIINKYLSILFLKVTFNTILIFFSLGIIMQLFEEINFFKDIDIGMYMPIFLSFLIVPGLLYDMFPFIILIAGILFFLKIKKSDEVTAMKISGMSNFTIMSIPCLVVFVIGIFFITSINPITAVLVKKYEMIKGSYEKDQDYLAAITANGIWIKERSSSKNNIIRAENLKNNHLTQITIYEFDINNNFLKRIEAESADISSFTWSLKNANVTNTNGEIILKNVNDLYYDSIYNLDKIKTLYSNIDTISFWSIGNEIELLEERGYSTKEMESKLHKSLAFPLFLLAMVILSGVFTLGTSSHESRLKYAFIAIITCVLVYFFNDFSAALGKTEKLAVEVAVWMPIVIIFIFGTVGMIYENEK